MNDRAARVRVVGPLARHADGFAAVLAQRGYAPSSAAGQLQLMAHVSRWLVQRGLAGSDLTPTVVEQFLQTRRAAGYGQWLSVRGMGPFLAYLRRVGLAPVPPAVPSKTPVDRLLADYRVFLVEERGLAESTAGSYLCVAQQFVSHRGVSDHGDLSRLSAVQVSEFVLASCQEPNVGSAMNLVVGLRALLRHLHLAGITSVHA